QVARAAERAREEREAGACRERLRFLLDVSHLGYLSHGVKRVLAAFAAALVLPAAAHAGGSSAVFAAAGDRGRSPIAPDSELEMGLLRLAGFKAVRVTSFWTPGLSEPTPHEAMVLSNVGLAAAVPGVLFYVSVYNAGSRTTPLTLTDRKAFASYAAAIVRDNPSFRDVIVCNAPKLNR